MPNVVQITVEGKDNFSATAQKVRGEAQGLSGGMGGLAKTALATAGGFIAAQAGLAGFHKGIALLESMVGVTQELGLSVAKLTRETGLSSEEASRLLFAFKHFGLGADDASRSIGIFAKKLKGVSDEETGVVSGGKSMALILKDVGVEALDPPGIYGQLMRLFLSWLTSSRRCLTDWKKLALRCNYSVDLART